MAEAGIESQRIDFSETRYVRRRRYRALKDRAASVSIGLGGISVIIAILLIFVYLLSEVLPMFRGASMEPRGQYSVPHLSSGKTLLLSIEEQTEIALRLTDSGQALFFKAENGALVKQMGLPLDEDVAITSVAKESAAGGMVAIGLSNGRALVLRHNYKISFPDDTRVITPVIEYPYGEKAFILDENGGAIEHLSFRDDENQLLFTGVANTGKLLLTRFVKEEDFLTEEVLLEREEIEVPMIAGSIRSLAVDVGQEWIFALTDNNKISVLRLRGAQVTSHSQVTLTEGQKVTDITFLLGGISLLVGDAEGKISQWFMVRHNQPKGVVSWTLEKIRSFDGGESGIIQIASEQRRKGFVAVNASGEASIFNTTAQRKLISESIHSTAVKHLMVAPRANAIIFETDDGQIGVWRIDNEHPEVSWSVLWQKVWYESYQEPEYIWQSSASNNDFEPKLSITPLAFGTLKAAFYAMLLAAPLAICGAIFTAHFMAPTMRRKVKPVIELMEALPTVILGFLAGLWLAPFVESHLPAIFGLLVLVPLAILLVSFGWHQMPKVVRDKVPEGWYAAFLIPLILLVSWGCVSASGMLEALLFGGDMRSWLSESAGISFDQRNALVVGLAMGFAVIPTIFSITEDAIFSVPRHLTNGSLALGATQWQTLVRVVLLTASPGIFSAVMIGFGRAVGETMIVLMATGNTPIMDWNIFEGMRTLAANIAVEMPESAVGSTHYRVLFLAAFVLFIFTFMFNTVAEIVRQRLRKRYGSL